MIADLKTRIATRKDYLSSLSKKYSDIDISKSSMLNVIDKNIVNATSKLNSMKDVDINKTLVDAEKQLLAKKAERLNEVIEQLNNLNDEKMMLDKEKGDVSTNLNDEIFKLKEENSSRVSTLNTEGASLQTRISMIHREIARLDSITDICPTCGQKLPDVTKVDTTSLKEEKESLSINLSSIRDKLNEEARLHANKVREVENKYSESLKNLTSKLDTLSSYIRTLNDEEKSLKNSIHEHELSIMKLNMEIESYEQRREEIQKEIDENIYNKKLIEEELLYNHKEREVVEKRLAIINKFNSVISRDFRGILLSSAIEYIDKQSKLYCKDIFDTNGIEFTLCGNNISISYNGKEYECLSGGERQKIDLIVQFSIRDMLCKFMNFSANILVLDEITDNLDMTGCQRVLNLISNKLSDVENIYIISHRQDLKIPFDKKILVEKTTEGISVIHS